MAVSLHANLRYQVIDSRLKNPDAINQWDDLADACALYLFDYLGIHKKPSKRTIAYDLARMKSGILGYEAPILYDSKCGYYYSNRKFSIFNIPLTAHMIEELKEALMVLKQMTKNEKFLSIQSTISVLEERLNLNIDYTRKPIIYLEHSLNEPGQKWLDEIYNSIKSQKVINIEYYPFDRPSTRHTFSPYFMKEYNNRWYVIGYEHTIGKCLNLALDRFHSIQTSIQPYNIDHFFDHDLYYKNVFGVTVLEGLKIETIVFKAIPLLSKYLITKPIHPTQTHELVDDISTLFKIEVCINYEIIHKLMSYGADIEILSPESLRLQIKEIANKMGALYNS